MQRNIASANSEGTSDSAANDDQHNKLSVVRPVKVLIFGFSITEEPGYVPALKELLSDTDITIVSRAIGGANIECVPHFQSILDYKSYDYVFFEITTCRRYSDKNPDAYKSTLAEIILQVRACGSQPAFIHLYRKGVDYDSDLLLNACEQVCLALQVRFINLAIDMVRFGKAGLLGNYLRDGIHTTPEGARFYAETMELDFKGIVANEKSHDVPFGSGFTDDLPAISQGQAALVPVDSLIDNREVLSFGRGNITMPYIEMQEGETICIELPFGVVLEGVLIIRGPRVGTFEVGLNDIGAFKLPAYDEHSYYRRYAVWMSPNFNARCFSIRQLDLEPTVQLVKGERYNGPRVGEICGFLVRSTPTTR